jgi:hypothetical protein
LCVRHLEASSGFQRSWSSDDDNGGGGGYAEKSLKKKKKKKKNKARASDPSRKEFK